MRIVVNHRDATDFTQDLEAAPGPGKGSQALGIPVQLFFPLPVRRLLVHHR